MTKKPGPPQSGRVPVTVLKLEPPLERQLKEMARDFGMPVAIYLRCLVTQHLKTPFEIHLCAPPKQTRRVASA